MKFLNYFRAQINALKDNYGQDNQDAIAKVKEIYEEMQLKKVYAKFEEDSYEDIVSQINRLPPEVLNHDIFYSLLSKIYKRNV